MSGYTKNKKLFDMVKVIKKHPASKRSGAVKILLIINILQWLA
jgi:hypothetical protein